MKTRTLYLPLFLSVCCLLTACTPRYAGQMILTTIGGNSLSASRATQLTTEINQRVERAGYEAVRVERDKTKAAFVVSFELEGPVSGAEDKLTRMFALPHEMGLWHTYQMTDPAIQQMWTDMTLPEGLIHRRDVDIVSGFEDVLAFALDTIDLTLARQTLMASPLKPANLDLIWSKEVLTPELGFGLYMINTEGESQAPITEQDIQTAKMELNQMSNQPMIGVELTESAVARWAEMTELAAEDRRGIAVVINGKAQMVPRVMSKITAGRLSITGNFNEAEAAAMAFQLHLGRLSQPLVAGPITIEEIKK
ncbi:MAG: hypothetical protein AAF206_10205 [Bacteroidota bacterium]